MHKKEKRLIDIKEIISKDKISKQDQLLNILLSKGYNITQATLSRDLKELNIGTKYNSEVGNIYCLPEDELSIKQNLPISLEGAISLEISGNLAVLKTISGFANSVAAIIDDKKINVILGTIAGNDTILIIIKEKVKKDELISSLSKEFTNIIRILKP